MKLDDLLSYIAYACILIGAAGIAGTLEREVVEMQGIVIALAILAVGLICAAWAHYESGAGRRRRR